MTKKHYKEFARRIKAEHQNAGETYQAGIEDAVRIFACIAETENPHFDRKRFMEACGLDD